MADKRRIQAPTNVINISGDNRQYFSFDQFILWALNGDSRFNLAGPGIRAAVRIETALGKLPPIVIDRKDGDPEPPERILILKKEDQELLLESLNMPQQTSGMGYPLSPARVLLPWIQAVEDAAEVTDD